MGFSKRLLSVILSAVLILSIFATVSTVSYAGSMPTEKEFIQKMIALEKKYKDGSKWTTTYKENGVSYASQCMGYANQIAYETFGSSQYSSNTKWSKSTSFGTIYAGDMVRIANSKGPDGHTIFVTKTEGNNIYYTDCNWVGKDTVRWNGVYTVSDLKKKFTYKWHLSGNNLTGNHACTKGKYKGISKEHPHYDLYQCSICSKTWEDKSKTHTMIDTCADCQPTPETPALKFEKVRGKYTLSWNKCKNANFYNVYIYDDYGSKVMEKRKITDTSISVDLKEGYYNAFCEAAYSDIKSVQSDYIFFMVSQETEEEIGEPLNTLKYNGNTYELYCYNADWYAAKDFCEARGAHLATVSDSDEWEKIMELCSDYCYGMIWLGATYADGKVNWIDSTKSNFANFGEIYYDSGCVCIDAFSDGKWSVYPSFDAYFILEREKGSINPLDFETESNADGTLTVVKYRGNEKEVTVPSVLNGSKITAIAENAFLDSNVTEITVPDTVLTVGEHAFGYSNYDGIYENIDGFTLNCRNNTAAYEYAAENGLNINVLPDVKLGDVNENGAVTASDALLARKLVAGQNVRADWTAADVNLDGKVTSNDVLLIRKHIAGQPSAF